MTTSSIRDQKLFWGFLLCMIGGGFLALMATFVIGSDYGHLTGQVINNLPDYDWYSNR